MRRFNIITFKEEDVDGQSTDALSLSTSFNFFGIQFVSWGVNMIGVSEKSTEDLAANMLTKKTIDEYLVG